MKDSQLQETSQEKIITSLLNIPGAKTGLLNCRRSHRVLSKIIVLKFVLKNFDLDVIECCTISTFCNSLN